jgi:hypothetical protein
MILRLNDAIPSIEGTPDECAEVIRQLNGGCITVTIALTAIDKLIVSTNESFDANMATYNNVRRDKTEPMPTTLQELTGNARIVAASRLPKIPHSEDAWIKTRMDEGKKPKEIHALMIDRGYTDITKTDVNNRCNYIIAHQGRTPAPPKFDPDEYIKEQRKRFVLPMEIAMSLTRKTGDPWSTDRVMTRISEMEVRPEEN